MNKVNAEIQILAVGFATRQYQVVTTQGATILRKWGSPTCYEDAYKLKCELKRTASAA